VLEEADECVYWLTHLRDAKLAKGPEVTSLTEEAIELAKIFSASCRTARGNRGDDRRRRRVRRQRNDPDDSMSR